MTRPKPCPRCGQPHARCSAHRRDGEPCTMRPMLGQRVCRMHGGKTPGALAKGARVVAEAEAAKAVATLGLPTDISPAEALLEEVRWTAGHVAWLRTKVSDLEAADLVWGVTKVKTGGDDRDTTEESKPSIWYELYTWERKHLVDVCAAALRAGVEERRVQVAEAQGLMLAGVIRAILDDLSLSAKQQALVGQVVPKHLRAITAGGAP